MSSNLKEAYFDNYMWDKYEVEKTGTEAGKALYVAYDFCKILSRFI